MPLLARSFSSPLVFLASLLLASGCVVQTSDGAGVSGSSGQAGSGQAGSGQAGSGQAGSGQAGSGQAGSAQAGSSGQAGSGVSDPCAGVPAQGRCRDELTFERCIVGAVSAEGQAAEPPQVVVRTCPAGTTCQQNEDWSGCTPTNACVEGASYCDDATTRVACLGGAWQKQPCAADQVCSSSVGASCASATDQAGQTFTIKGKLLYEYRPVKDDHFGYGDLTTDAARGVIATAYDGDEYLGGSYTSDDDGTFAIEVNKKPSSNTKIYFLPMLYDEGGVPQFAVAVPDTLTISNLKSTRYYSFGHSTGEALDAGDVVVTEAEGSPAIHIHQWVLYSILQLRQTLPAAKPFNVLALWAPDKRFDCANGTCYAPRGYGASVEYGSGTDFYEGVLLLAGTEPTPHHLSSSVILHEFGHYVMEAYSRSPHEAGPHSFSMEEPPGMAWSEGWATYLGQSMKQDSFYVDRQEGTTWFYDVSKVQSSSPKPDPQGPIDQKINETIVSHMLWHLDSASPDNGDQSALGQPAVVQAFGSERVRQASLDRGYPTVDFIDLLDGLRCGGAASGDVLSVTKIEGYPYDDKATCAP